MILKPKPNKGSTKKKKLQINPVCEISSKKKMLHKTLINILWRFKRTYQDQHLLGIFIIINQNIKGKKFMPISVNFLKIHAIY